MREVKFKMWDGKKMHLNPMTDEKEEVLCLFGNGIWLQFTGLKDKNGKEIYEHDVLNFDWRLQATSELYADDCENIKGVVKFQNGKYVVRFFNDSMSFDLSDVNQSTFERFWREAYVSAKDDYFKMTGFEVIGNIHENPELLDNAK